MPIIINYELVRTLALQATEDYTNKKTVEGDRDGLFHGEAGKVRNQIINEYLQSASNNKTAILAVLLAVFGKPDAGFLGWLPGRSSRLAGLIANKFYTGTKKCFFGCEQNDIDTLRSPVFARDYLEKISNQMEACDVYGGGEYAGSSCFNNTKGARILLQKALRNDFNSEQQIEILTSMQKLKAEFNRDRKKYPKIDLKVFPSQKPAPTNHSPTNRK